VTVTVTVKANYFTHADGSLSPCKAGISARSSVPWVKFNKEKKGKKDLKMKRTLKLSEEEANILQIYFWQQAEKWRHMSGIPQAPMAIIFLQSECDLIEKLEDFLKLSPEERIRK
jgi:hypothetical protein